MEIPGRRSNYTLLSQYPDEQMPSATPPPQYYDSSISSDTKLKPERGFDWDSSGDHRLNQQANTNRIANLNMHSSIGLQRQSSGSSFGESTMSGEYYPPTMSTGGGNEMETYGYTHEDGNLMRLRAMDAGVGTGSSGKSWAQQTEESYQLQLALALRLSSDATCADDPNFLDPMPDESSLRATSSNLPEALSHRFWVGFYFYCLSCLMSSLMVLV